jgi:copper chaperone NosL
VWIYEWYKNRKKASVTKLKTATSIAAAILLFLSSCSTAPEPFVIGKDVCYDCKMTIMDEKFGGEIITKKGKIYKFDDAHCMANFLKGDIVKTADIAQTLFLDSENKGTFLDVKSLYFVVSPSMKSPMNSNAAAFSNKTIADKIAVQNSGEVTSWDALLKTL